MLDFRTKRGADAASDHHLVVTKLRLKLKRCTTSTSTRTKYNVHLLLDKAVADVYQITLSNRYRVLADMQEENNQDNNDDIELYWHDIKQIWKNSCEEVVGKSKRQHKPWITTETLKKMEDRKSKDLVNRSRTRAAKSLAQQQYSQAHKEVRRSVKQGKRKYTEELARQAQEAAVQRNMKDLYDTTKKLAGKYKQSCRPVRNKEGEILTKKEDQLKRWAEHFEGVLNRPAPGQIANIPPAENPLPVNCNIPTKEEVRRAIIALRNGKAAGPDEIPAEALKAAPYTSAAMLGNIIERIWEEEAVPEEWKEGFLVKLPKKGDQSECDNYRGIMLLSVPGKVLNKIMLERLKAAVDRKLRDHQAGF